MYKRKTEKNREKNNNQLQNRYVYSFLSKLLQLKGHINISKSSALHFYCIHSAQQQQMASKAKNVSEQQKKIVENDANKQ